MRFFDGVQVPELVPVDDEVGAPADTRDPIHREAAPLIGGDLDIEQHERYGKGVDDRRRKQVEHTRVAQECRYALFELFVRAADVLIEPDVSTVQRLRS
jgi:hypothetical protein